MASALSYLGKWGDELAFKGKSPVKADPTKAQIDKNNIDFLKKSIDTVTPAPINFDIAMMSTPAKDKVSGIKWMDDVYKVILAKGDVEKMWNDVIKSYDAKGLQDAIKEVNQKATEMGIK